MSGQCSTPPNVTTACRKAWSKNKGGEGNRQYCLLLLRVLGHTSVSATSPAISGVLDKRAPEDPSFFQSWLRAQYPPHSSILHPPYFRYLPELFLPVEKTVPDRKHPTPTQMNRNTSSLLADMGSRMTNAPSMKTVVGKMYCMMPSEIIGTLRMPRLRPNWGMAETNPQPMSSRSMYAPPARKCPSPLSPSQIR